MKNPQQLLWDDVQKYIDIKRGYLIADDTILDKPKGPKIEGVGFHYSGKHKRSVRGLCLVSLVWTDGKHVFPVDFRVYNKDNGITKNEHLRDMLKTARNRGFTPKMVMFDSWYSARETLLLLQSWSWKYMVGIKSNRVLLYFPSPYQPETLPLKSFFIDQEGLRCRLKGLGFGYSSLFLTTFQQTRKQILVHQPHQHDIPTMENTQTHFVPHRKLSQRSKTTLFFG